MNEVSETDNRTAAERQRAYAARRAAWVANLPRIVETPGQEYWPIYRKPEWSAGK